MPALLSIVSRHAFGLQTTQSRRSGSNRWQQHQRTWRAASGDERGDGASTSAPEAAPQAVNDGDSVFEQQVLAKRRKPRQPKQQQQQRPVVISATRDRVYGGGPLTLEQRIENTVVVTLGTLFSVIVAEGIFLASSGFLSESLDQFAQDVVYPAFSPTLALFLAISTLYGLWKTRSGESKEGDGAN